MKRRITAILLTLCMVLSALPGTARAEEGTPTFDPIWPCESAWYISTNYFYWNGGNVKHHSTRSGYLNAVDITGGGNICATEAGIVSSVVTGCTHDNSTFCGCNGGFGNYVVILHNNGMQSLYGHMKSINVTKDSSVSKGQVIGIMGSTGNSSGTHLHFELYSKDNNGRYTIELPFKNYFEPKYSNQIKIGANSKRAAESVLENGSAIGDGTVLTDYSKDVLQWYVDILNTKYILSENGDHYYSNGPHIHSFTIEGYEEAHPHKKYRKCSCGEFEYTGDTVSISTCEQCYPPTMIDNLSGQFYCVYENGSEHLIKSGTCLLYNKTTAKNYCLPIQDSRLVYSVKIPEGTYQVFVLCDAENADDNCQGALDDITLSNTANLGSVKLQLNFIKHAFLILDKATDEPLTGVDWELWKGEQCIESHKNDSYMIASEMQVGTEYTLRLHKGGYLDESVRFTSYYNGTQARIRTEVVLQPTQGDLGNGVQWKFADNTLTFWGNGPITDSPTIPLWGEFGLKNMIHHVQIEPGITRIGDRTAYGQWCYEELTISIPETVTSIGEVAFGFLHLHNLEVPESVDTIEEAAFDTANDLTVKFLGNAPSNLSDTAFNRASNITILYPAGNRTWDTYIGQNLGATDNINWISYQPSSIPEPAPKPDPDPFPTPTPAPIPQPPVITSPTEQPAEANKWVNPYGDVFSDDWYYESVAYATDRNLLKGISADRFAPNSETSRAMAWMVLARIAGVNVDSATPWYSYAQSWVESVDISDGIAPDRSITRQELITMLYRFSGSPEVTEAQLTAIVEFTDSDMIAPYALQAMAWAVSCDIINGSGGMLLPQSFATRAQMATILMRFCKQTEL